MGWREDVKFKIGRVGQLYLGEGNGQMGTLLTATAAELNALADASALAITEHGAGVAGAVTAYRHTYLGVITTQILVDIGGLTVTGTAQGAAIGLAGVDACYIGRYVLANYGSVFKIEMACVETPTEDTATFEQDIDLCYTTAADVKAGEDVDVDIIAAGKDWAAGEVSQALQPQLTPDGDYLYLAAGDTDGDTGTYGAGKFLITFSGHAG